jgi:hypothetical protein
LLLYAIVVIERNGGGESLTTIAASVSATAAGVLTRSCFADLDSWLYRVFLIFAAASVPASPRAVIGILLAAVLIY